MSLRPLLATLLLATATTLPGCLYADIKTPLDTDLDETRLGDKVGKSSWQGWFWMVATGDAGIQAAAENGGITVIRHADTEMFSVVFGLYIRRTTVVYGD